MGEVPPSDDPRDVGRAELVLRLAGDLWRIVRAEPEPQHIKLLGKIWNGLGFRPLLVCSKEGRIEVVVPNLEKHVILPAVQRIKTPNGALSGEFTSPLEPFVRDLWGSG